MGLLQPSRSYLSKGVNTLRLVLFQRYLWIPIRINLGSVRHSPGFWGGWNFQLLDGYLKFVRIDGDYTRCCIDVMTKFSLIYWYWESDMFLVSHHFVVIRYLDLLQDIKVDKYYIFLSQFKYQIKIWLGFPIGDQFWCLPAEAAGQHSIRVIRQMIHDLPA